jgi:hypothetical protein
VGRGRGKKTLVTTRHILRHINVIQYEMVLFPRRSVYLRYAHRENKTNTSFFDATAQDVLKRQDPNQK